MLRSIFFRLRESQFIRALLPHDHDWARCTDKFWLDECSICTKTRLHQIGTPTRAQKDLMEGYRGSSRA
jgi:hypothetical protein